MRGCKPFFFFFLLFKKILVGGLLLYNIVVVFAIHSHKSAMGVHAFPILTLPPHPNTQGHPSAPALSTLPHALNLDWQRLFSL